LRVARPEVACAGAVRVGQAAGKIVLATVGRTQDTSLSLARNDRCGSIAAAARGQRGWRVYAASRQRPERIAGLVDELVRFEVDVLVVGARAAKSTTTSIPIVFAGSSDPAAGVAPDLPREGR
jgi:hypothetical protein